MDHVRRSVGGDRSAVLFQPNRLDTVTGKKTWECSRASVTGFEVVDRDLTVLAGGMRKRLGIQTAAGIEMFVVNDLEKKVMELREIFPSSREIDW